MAKDKRVECFTCGRWTPAYFNMLVDGTYEAEGKQERIRRHVRICETCYDLRESNFRAWSKMLERSFVKLIEAKHKRDVVVAGESNVRA